MPVSGAAGFSVSSTFCPLCTPTPTARVRDFKGVPPKGFDGRGNYNMGLKEQIIFPEIVYDKVDKVRGMDITMVTTARTDEEAKALLTHLGVPFREA